MLDDEIVDQEFEKYKDATEGSDFARYWFYYYVKKNYEYLAHNKGLNPLYRDMSNLDNDLVD
jgi:hypothetical protein